MMRWIAWTVSVVLFAFSPVFGQEEITEIPQLDEPPLVKIPLPTELTISDLFIALDRIEAATSKTDYGLSISVPDVIDLAEGRGLSTDDPVYCEKSRDLCLLAICGTTVESHVNAACWTHCTEMRFEKCEVALETGLFEVPQ